MSKLAEMLGIHLNLYAALVGWGLIFIRVFIVLFFTPFLGSRAIPGQVRLSLGMLIALFLYPFVAKPFAADFPADNGLIIALFFKEIFIGFSIGLVTTMVFHAIEAAGNIVDNQRGGANAQIFVPQLGQVSIFGLFLFWLAIAFFIAIDGHRFFLQAFFKSYETLPIYQLPRIANGFSPFLEFLVRLSGNVLVIAVQLSAPVVIAILLVDLVLGLANKMAPQINVYELGFAIKGYVAPLLVYISLLILVSQMKVILGGMLASVTKLVNLLAL
jgi:flagellar biosynthetic protein FliR